MQFDLTESPYLAQLQAEFATHHRMWRNSVKRGLELFGRQWALEFDTLLKTVVSGPEAISAAARGYGLFSLDSMRRQKEFEIALEYPSKTYAEAANEVYYNEEHMMSEYLPGLLLSHFLWPHHYRQLQFFDAAFLGPMSLSSDQTFAEVGVGTGIYSRRLLDTMPGARGAGFDISPSSCSFAEKHLQGAGSSSRYQMNQRDVIADPPEPVPWLICVEVLEHLEDPVGFLKGLKAILAKNGKAFITAALNAGHADHIYLYRQPGEVLAQLEEAGFVLEQSFAAAAYDPPAPGVPVPLAAAFVVH